jgi:Holliday junction resolvase
MSKKVSESAIQAKLVKFLKEKKFYFLKIIMAGSAGHPDYIACVNGKFIAMECKSSTGKLSPLQEWRKKEVEASGGVWVTVSPENFEKTKKYLTLHLI